MNYFLPAFGDHLPGVPNDVPTVLKTFPQYNVVREGLDLDLTPLLLADGVVVDSNAYEYITNPTRKYLRPMAATMHKLQDAGRLHLEDYGKQSAPFAVQLSAWVDEQIEEPKRWLPPLRAQISSQSLLMDEQLSALDLPVDREIEAIPFGVLVYLMAAHGRVSISEARRVELLILKSKARHTREETEVLREIVRPYVTQASLDILLSQKLGMPYAMWPPDELLYRKLEPPTVVQPLGDKITKEQLLECRRLFAETLPGLKPIDLDETLEFLKSRRARRSLKYAIQLSVRGSNVLDAKSIDILKDKYMLNVEETAKLGKVLSILVAVAGLVVGSPLLVGASEMAREGLHFLLGLLDYSSDELLERKADRRISWYVELLKIAGRRTTTSL